MKIDLHTHSYYSDGVLSPTELVERAVANQVDVLALTDHDTLLGLDEAFFAAKSHGIKIVPGVEMSCTWREQTIHVLGLNVDPSHLALNERLAEVYHFRKERADNIIKKLTKFGIPGIGEYVARSAKGIHGRMHIARYLAEKGYAQTPGKAFKRFLSEGKPGHSKMSWMSLEEAVNTIHHSGGIAVIAHPRRYDFNAKKMTVLFEYFKSLGGHGVEVATSTQNKSDQLLVANVAKYLDLALSVGSDFHEPCPYNEVGKANFLISIEGAKLVSDLL